MDDYEYYGEATDADRPRDPRVDDAIATLRAFFTDNLSRVFYSTQIETSLERDYFHWITGKALLELANANQIKRRQVAVQSQMVNFYASKKHRYVERQLNKMTDLLERIFDPDFTRAVGRTAS